MTLNSIDNINVSDSDLRLSLILVLCPHCSLLAQVRTVNCTRNARSSQHILFSITPILTCTSLGFLYLSACHCALLRQAFTKSLLGELQQLFYLALCNSYLYLHWQLQGIFMHIHLHFSQQPLKCLLYSDTKYKMLW